SNIVTMATMSKDERARARAAQLSLPPLHEIAARGLDMIVTKGSNTEVTEINGGPLYFLPIWLCSSVCVRVLRVRALSFGRGRPSPLDCARGDLSVVEGQAVPPV